MSAKYIVYTTPTFEKEYSKLKKRFPKIDDDFEEFIDEVEIDGDIGSDLSGIVNDGNKVFKKRMKNSSARKSKRGGFRVIEYLVTEDNIVYLLDIYSKTDQVNITNNRIRELIKQNAHKF